jgi:hypothetical protein
VSDYVRDIVIKKKFQNDEVTVVLKPVKMADVLQIGDRDLKNATPQEITDLVVTMKGYVKTLSGLKAHDASEVTTDEFFESAYFFELVTEVLGDWIERALPANPSSPGASLTA